MISCRVSDCDHRAVARRLCDKHYRRLRRWGDPTVVAIIVGDDHQRLTTKLKPEPDGCLTWTGAVNDTGYGIMRFRGAVWLAHRVAFVLAHGSIPDGLMVCHHCDNPPCCNVAHLFTGTAADNNQDRDRKGRGVHPKGDVHAGAPGRRARGESVGSALLTERQVRGIRSACSLGVSQAAIATQFGVSQSSVSRIVRRVYWAHVA